MTTHQDYCAGVLSQCEFGEWRWRVSAEPDHSILQVCASDRCARTGEPFEWSGRKWRLSVFMTKSEIVQTAFMAVLATRGRGRGFCIGGRPSSGRTTTWTRSWHSARATRRSTCARR